MFKCFRCPPRHHRHHHHYHRRVTYILFTVNKISVRIPIKEYIQMSTQVSIGHEIDMSIDFLDQHGNPMLEVAKPDTAPVWSNINSTVETVAAALDGMSAVAKPVAVGSDTISVDLVVAGVKFNATLDVNVITEVQVLTSIKINPVVV